MLLIQAELPAPWAVWKRRSSGSKKRFYTTKNHALIHKKAKKCYRPWRPHKLLKKVAKCAGEILRSGRADWQVWKTVASGNREDRSSTEAAVNNSLDRPQRGLPPGCRWGHWSCLSLGALSWQGESTLVLPLLPKCNRQSVITELLLSDVVSLIPSRKWQFKMSQ